MAYLYLDDSKHQSFGFSLAAFVMCDADPTHEVELIFRRRGFDPNTFEFKSSARMKDDINLQKLRSALKTYIGRRCKIAVCVVDGDKRLGPAALRLLDRALAHPYLARRQHQVFFDEGLFPSTEAAENLVQDTEKFKSCEFHFEQDSRRVLGMVLSDKFEPVSARAGTLPLISCKDRATRREPWRGSV
ncbi:hypothetical protein [uncultured Roseovarius sp.]|uniref:hypothetical protein n=1 Tax=uncultured Roseovarius sp. TaxID=293344 RepID=UPI00259A8F2D|nr:hypothetical protein [uncultured Roseovarius sp.]